MLLYRDRELRRHQYFTAADWPGGIYISPGMAGSRSGGLIASTWAAMVTLGEEGYLDAAREILAAADAMRAGVEAVERLRAHRPIAVHGRLPQRRRRTSTSSSSTTSSSRGAGGSTASSCRPGLHFCVTRPNSAEGVVDRFLADLRAAVDAARGRPAGSARSGALYGLSGAGPAGVAAAGQLLTAALDAFYEPAP